MKDPTFALRMIISTKILWLFDNFCEAGHVYHFCVSIFYFNLLNVS